MDADEDRKTNSNREHEEKSKNHPQTNPVPMTSASPVSMAAANP